MIIFLSILFVITIQVTLQVYFLGNQQYLFVILRQKKFLVIVNTNLPQVKKPF